MYEEMLAKIRQGEPPARFVDTIGAFQVYVDQKKLGPYFDLGIWTEGIRLAAREGMRGKPEIIVSILQDAQDLARLQKKLSNQDVSPEVMTALKTLSKFSEKKSISKKEHAVIFEQAEIIIEEMQ